MPRLTRCCARCSPRCSGCHGRRWRSGYTARSSTLPAPKSAANSWAGSSRSGARETITSMRSRTARRRNLDGSPAGEPGESIAWRGKTRLRRARRRGAGADRGENGGTAKPVKLRKRGEILPADVNPRRRRPRPDVPCEIARRRPALRRSVAARRGRPRNRGRSRRSRRAPPARRGRSRQPPPSSSGAGRCKSA